MNHPSQVQFSITELLQHYGLSPRKKLGQHFLVGDGILNAIVAAADLETSDTVVEVGPGTGLLTRRLAEAAGQVIAVELDTGMVRLLRGELQDLPNVRLVEGDILALSPEELTADVPYMVVANLPYYIASRTVRLFLETTRRPRRMVVTVQREVAQVMTAKPGEMRLLSLAVQLFGEARVVRRVMPGSFVPAPKVESAVVRIDVTSQPQVGKESLAHFFAVARAGFSAPRKQIRNSLAQGLAIKRSSVEKWLIEAAIDPQTRPASLTIEDWHRLTDTSPLETRK